jgi:hypothetical protein
MTPASNWRPVASDRRKDCIVGQEWIATHVNAGKEKLAQALRGRRLMSQ